MPEAKLCNQPEANKPSMEQTTLLTHHEQNAVADHVELLPA